MAVAVGRGVLDAGIVGELVADGDALTDIGVAVGSRVGVGGAGVSVGVGVEVAVAAAVIGDELNSRCASCQDCGLVTNTIARPLATASTERTIRNALNCDLC